ncbi:MarR family winged helix-turn-helix transcriptional regulator [Pseudonocardia lacus]|uniref:MarR family winged helix-turn-helix transcriptional regulator n=1 Tax=Pseudonocardia lacus TaxID=2835865 RepID=UPI001BDC9B91|nr:MarR family transcriptional regulator [Pseudonocardia lacus]
MAPMAHAPLDPDTLADRLAEVYLIVGPLYRRVLRAVERDAPVSGISVGVRAVLDLLARNGPMTVPQMGRAQSLSRQFVQRMVNEAVAAGHVELTDNPAHRRSRLARLTDAGRATIDAVTAREHDLLRQVGGDLTDDEVRACVRVLGQMLVALDDVDVD